jgi:hypothetical protein
VKRRSEEVVEQCWAQGLCTGDAPSGNVWVVLTDGVAAYPDAQNWKWLAERLEPAEFSIVEKAVRGNPSWVVFVPSAGPIEVVRPTLGILTLPVRGRLLPS